MNPSIFSIVKKALTVNGYDGLCHPDLKCGCGLDDLMPCGDPNEHECVAAYKHADEMYTTEKLLQ